MLGLGIWEKLRREWSHGSEKAHLGAQALWRQCWRWEAAWTLVPAAGRSVELRRRGRTASAYVPGMLAPTGRSQGGGAA